MQGAGLRAGKSCGALNKTIAKGGIFTDHRQQRTTCCAVAILLVKELLWPLTNDDLVANNLVQNFKLRVTRKNLMVI